MKTNKSMSRVERMHREKVTRYSIRKYSFGAASVAVAALFMFLGNGAVSADMTAVQPQGKPELKTKQNDENTGSGKVQGNTTKQVGNTVVAETIAKPEEPVTPALDKTKLEKYIKEIEAKLDKGAYANKTEKSVALLKAELAAAKEVLQNATTQAELTKAYSKLVTVANTKLVTKPTEKKVTPEVDTTNGQPTVGKKAGNTEPKAGTNSIENTGSHDPRNGKAIANNPLRTGEQPAIEDDSYNSFVFSGNDQDFKNHSELKWISKEGDGTFLDRYGNEKPANRNNESLTYGEDSHGKYIEWKSTQPRGGGFRLTIDKELGEEYTIGVKFAFDKTTGNWRKIVDYKNSKDDT
ncbi:YSIRK-type signal peptide-containing protein, partial [Streptococcus mitis]|uniref:YSIRK-type signal peptide-containing protein n=1 Tax=Streptococcus mitis TaxID=28037 RepID=UPI0010719861